MYYIKTIQYYHLSFHVMVLNLLLGSDDIFILESKEEFL